MAKYSIVAAKLDLNPELYSDGDQLAAMLTNEVGQVLDKTTKGCTDSKGKGTKIICHQISQLGDYIIASFLLRH